ncbi:membrane protein insertion efficiency factor YidD [Candidatus Wolfebacteria bacterium RBG_13_41_7]|uniref:Putative membrane protein insertion efficiency factor n=1 Tax=Candidatus Wolfebacteria bacterium RBG_13_41_7 TaxID=1802554 RepID=A0A1F8DM24_9BACT|nr:MAG: membrane protein insertion efficiency factor YidD [Candidatus Wolfebacteria bacterium RBG_13_41_7]
MFILAIRAYQRTFSKDHGMFKHLYPYGFCRFRPTCSDYAIDAINKYGFIKGGLLSAWRILRCHPWSKGGYDPVE